MAKEVEEIEEVEEETQEEEIEDDGKSEAMKELEKEIKGAIKDNNIREEDEEEEEDNEEETPSEESEEEEDTEEPGEEEDEEDPIPNELKERAIRAGLSLDKIQKYPNAELLEEYVTVKEEAKTAGQSKEGGASEDEEGKKFEQTLNEIFDVDNEQWEEEDVQRFSKMKELFAGMYKSNNEQKKLIEDLRSNSYSEGDFLNNKFTELGKSYEDLFGKKGSVSGEQQKARDKVSRYIGFVTEEAQASGETISNDEAFKRALNGAYGDKVVEEKGKKVAEKAKARAKRAINAPRGDDGKFLKKDDEEPLDGPSKAIKALEEKYG